MSVDTKKVKVTFFITGQDDKSKTLNAPLQFGSLWKDHFSKSTKPKLQTRVLTNNSTTKTSTRDLVLSIIEWDKDAEFYFGYVGTFRDTTLPTKFNKDTLIDQNIDLDNQEEIMEKSYFLYYPKTDILVFHQNHLGPRADDLGYLLYMFGGLKRVHFEPIWKDADIKALLENNNVIKNGSLTLALPRNFSESNLDLSNSWSKEIISMMSSTGMSRLAINFWGRAGRKTEKGYLNDNIRAGIKELISTYGTSRRLGKSEPAIKKAEVTLKSGGKKQTLLNQDLSTKLDVNVVKGYPTLQGMRQTLVFAKTRCQDTLLQYYHQKR
ncbi:hypothetical protein [Vibrio echinoideorum]|uniref:hypothetical protein n=1 Tax=Vibrio echinoideorum TaxID=2100116 RepID=UPI0010803E58|nr:hypothetical protein [Vibrio echinoideorum]